MKMSFLVLISVGLFVSTSLGNIVEEGNGIVYGDDHAFGLTAPKGWMLDNESGVSQGMHAVFYPKGGSWRGSTIVAYASSRPRTKKIATADDAANFVVEDFHANGSPKYKAKRVKTIKTEMGQTAVIYHFSGDQWGNSEAVAYYVEDKTINYIVLTSRDPKKFADSLDSFDELAKSYFSLGDDPFGKTKPSTNRKPKTKKAEK